MKIALIFPGNLACYFTGLNNFKYLTEKYNVDIFILYSKNINYIHTLDNFNSNLEIDENDIIKIKWVFKNNLKYINSIENYPDFKDIQTQFIDKFNKNKEWIDKDENQYLKLESFEQKRKYLDQFLRTYLLYNEVMKYQDENNLKYDYIFRFRIDQFLSKSLIDNLFTDLEKYDLITFNFMDNFYIIKNLYFEFFPFLYENLGRFQTNECHPNYKLGPEIQFKESLKELISQKNIKKIKFIQSPFRITLSIFDLENYYFYVNKGVEPSGKFEYEKNINFTNYKEKIPLFSEYKIINHNLDLEEKYKNLKVKFYSIHEFEINDI